MVWYKSVGKIVAGPDQGRRQTEHLGYFDPTPVGEVDAALAYDAAACAAGRPESANFEPVDSPPLPGAAG